MTNPQPLPELPEPAHSREAPDYTADQMRAYALAAVEAEREACAIAGGAAANAGLDGHGVAAAIRSRKEQK